MQGERIGQVVPSCEVEAVREQMELILAHPLFSHSKRYPTLFRYIVERTVEGRIDHLKERSLGVEVFGRDPSYSTNDDPVVRITAGEIRKRIAQYYHQPGHEHELRIDLPSGSYVAEFRLPLETEVISAPEPIVIAQTARLSSSWWLYLIAAAALAALAVSFTGLKPRTELDRFWSPVVDSPGSVLISIGGRHDPLPSVRPASPTSTENVDVSVGEMLRMDQVAFSDATTLSRLTGLLQAKGKTYHVRRTALTTLADLREGPTILIGGFNNDWTVRLGSQLRFTFEKEPVSKRCWIQDRRDPGRSWVVDNTLPYLKLDRDYALISRIWDPTIGRVLLVAAGIANYGTLAAGEFLTDPSYMEAVAKQAPKNWDRKNVQIVIETNVINGNTGPPSIVATHFW